MGTDKSRHWHMEPPKIYVGKAISKKYVFSVCLQKLAIVSEDWIVTRSWFQIVGAATGKVHLPILRCVWWEPDEKCVWWEPDEKCVWWEPDERCVWWEPHERCVWWELDERCVWWELDDRCVCWEPDERCVLQTLADHKDLFFLQLPQDDIKEIHRRRYQLKDNALEIFLTNGKTCLIAFSSTQVYHQSYTL